MKRGWIICFLLGNTQCKIPNIQFPNFVLDIDYCIVLKFPGNLSQLILIKRSKKSPAKLMAGLGFAQNVYCDTLLKLLAKISIIF